ncbi:hypothetical protein AB205_0085410 [Aquarana catesbeiana]|uniref:Uncharacterized protein n=1 Tax=Aquarana catesbeiana TaxID=8400 RepID=A0A2G9RS27_AQUCT|nr:hypothetical protein AB205_0085410 [Aquarana catesbeiana]
MRSLKDQIEARESLSTLPSTLLSTPAEASEDQPGPSILEEVEEPSWSQEDLSQDKALECGRQEEVGVSVSQEHDECAISIVNASFTRPSASVSYLILSMRVFLRVGNAYRRTAFSSEK